MSFLWIDRHLIDKADVRVSPFDHGFLYGDGVWEPFRVFAGQPFRLADHLHNLFHFADFQGLTIPLSRDELTRAVETVIRANHRTEGYGRVIVARGPGTLGPDPRKIDPRVIIIVEDYRPFPAELSTHGLEVITYPAPDADGRLLGAPQIVRAKQQALERGCLEAILVNPEGRLIGSTEGMLFLVKDGALVVAGGHVPDAIGYRLAALAGEAGALVVEYAVKREELLAADEALIGGTSCGVIGIIRVDGQSIGNGAEGTVTRQLRQQYLAMTRGAG